ncbi:hypothetical protein ACLKA7_007464 [Drosophila subpalustris]
MNALVQEEEEAAHFYTALFKLQGNHPTIIWLITDIINSSSSKRSSENCTQLCVDSEVALQVSASECLWVTFQVDVCLSSCAKRTDDGQMLKGQRPRYIHKQHNVMY